MIGEKCQCGKEELFAGMCKEHYQETLDVAIKSMQDLVKVLDNKGVRE